MSALEEKTGGEWLAPVRLTERMMQAMLRELHFPDSHVGDAALRDAIEAAWAEARYASPSRGRTVQP